MNAFEGIISDLDTTNFDFIKKGLEPLLELDVVVQEYCAEFNNVLKTYQKKGEKPSLKYLSNWEEFKTGKRKNSLKENIEPTNEIIKESNARPRRNAFKEATQSISDQLNISLNTRLRRNIKQEKFSICTSENSTESLVDDKKIKKEDEEMPAPSRPAPKKKRKKTRGKTLLTQEKVEEIEKPRDSDVIVNEPKLSTINIADSEEEVEKTITNVEKTRETSSKRTRTVSDDDKQGSKEKKSKSSEDETITNYEDAVSTFDNNNATFIAKPSPAKNVVTDEKMNATVVIENPKCVKNLIPQTMNDLMTDDESEEEITKKSLPKKVTKIPGRSKQIFSPFEASPVKKKVQAFERLHEEAAANPTRITRTKSKAQAKEQEKEVSDSNENEKKNNVKEKAKIFTPLNAKFIPKAASTTMKAHKLVSSASNESLLSAKSASVLKASQAEYREREKRRREKEEEALKKREALLQAQIEEKKRRREEKQLKAQQQREALEKEKLKALEAQRLKDERHRLLLIEQELKKQQMKEELEKKRMLVKIRAQEEKKREEEKRIEEQRKAEEMTAKLAKQDEDIVKMLKKKNGRAREPVYMRERTPQLPSYDCYDSDDEDYRRVDFMLDWEKNRNIIYKQKCTTVAGEAVKNTFFLIQAQTPDLQEIFESIEPQKLKRTSSAVWHKPPRFTMIPGLESHDETAEFEDYD